MNLSLKCRCGCVTGVVHDVQPGRGNRLICYCRDCQAFARHLNVESEVLNPYGGTEVLQLPPSLIDIERGVEHLSCLRLSEKGLYRWFTSCCNTPIGNTVGLKIPFVGLVHSFIDPEQDVDLKIGPLFGAVYTKQAVGNLPEEMKGTKSQAAIMFRILRRVFVWKLFAKGRPTPFFDERGEPIVKPRIVG